MGLLERSDLVLTPLDLRRSTHPVTWLRVKLLAEGAAAAGFPQEGRTINDEWTAVAEAMGVTEDYHGYYDPAIGALAAQAVQDMLVEAAPRPYSSEEAAGGGWQGSTGSVVRLLNWAWRQHLADPGQYPAWEAAAIQRYLADPAALTA